MKKALEHFLEKVKSSAAMSCGRVCSCLRVTRLRPYHEDTAELEPNRLFILGPKLGAEVPSDIYMTCSCFFQLI